jgi:hypothetical protein
MKRQPANLSESLCHRLNSYAIAASAAGVSVLALAQPAEAKIVYTKAHRQIALNTQVNLDLNHDGITDFRLTDEWGPIDRTGYLSLDAFWRNGVWASQAGYIASALPAGIRVSSNAPFAPGSMEQMAAIMNTGGQSSDFGPWCGVRNRYLGLKFAIGSSTHFGWARLNVACLPTGILGTLTGYAYETIPNKPIIAGRTHGKDVITLQDASLGHLARGASALAAWREKEQ